MGGLFLSSRYTLQTLSLLFCSTKGEGMARKTLRAGRNFERQQTSQLVISTPPPVTSLLKVIIFYKGQWMLYIIILTSECYHVIQSSIHSCTSTWTIKKVHPSRTLHSAIVIVPLTLYPLHGDYSKSSSQRCTICIENTSLSIMYMWDSSEQCHESRIGYWGWVFFKEP